MYLNLIWIPACVRPGTCRSLVGDSRTRLRISTYSEVSMIGIQIIKLSEKINGGFTLIISGSMAAWRQISLWTSRGNRGKKDKSSAVFEAGARVELAPLPRDKEDTEREAIVVVVCSSLFF